MPPKQTASRKVIMLLRRFFVPRFVVSIYYLVKYGAKVSPSAEVEISKNLTFGPKCVVSSFTKIKASDGPLTIGARCGFSAGCWLASGEGGLHIGDNLVCGPNVVIMSGSYRYDKLGVHLHDQGVTSKGTRIGNNVWLGAGTVVLDGAEIGDDSIVAANSVVNRKFPAQSMLQGNPAKPIRGFARKA